MQARERTGVASAGMDNVIVVVRARMANPEPQQLLRLIPVATCTAMVATQLSGHHTRRTGGDAVKAKVDRVAQASFEKNLISTIVRDHLVGWDRGTRDRAKQLARHSFLDHRPGAVDLPTES